MSNKQTALNWLEEMINKMEAHEADLPALRIHIEQAKEMERKKQQKYDEMLAMLEGMCNVWNEVGINDYSMSNYMNLVQQLIKEAKEL